MSAAVTSSAPTKPYAQQPASHTTTNNNSNANGNSSATTTTTNGHNNNNHNSNQLKPDAAGEVVGDYVLGETIGKGT